MKSENNISCIRWWQFLPLLLIFHLSLLTSCTSCEQPSREELASLAARGYYEHLIHGEYEEFLEGKDSLPAGYHAQMLENLKMFKAQQEKAHGGICNVEISQVRQDTLVDYTSVFLMLTFVDSTKEEIIVPMVERQGRWRMR